MCYFVKSLLVSYSHLENIIGDMDKLICQKAYTSFGAASGECVSNKIICLMDKKNRLIVLKLKLDDIFEKFSDEERWLLEHKYFRRRKYIKKYLGKIAVTFSQRTYFRKQNKLLNKISCCLLRGGLSERWFLDNYSDIDWLISLYMRIREKERKKIELKEKAA